MAKRGHDNDGRPDKGKIRILYLEVDGNNDSIQEALKTMAQTMKQPLHVIGPARAAVPAAAITNTEAADSEVEEVEEVENAEVTEPDDQPAPRKRGPGVKKDWNAGIALIPNLDFMPSGKSPLKQFVVDKKPSNDMETVLVVVYYMQHMMDMPSVSPGHIRTAMKEVGAAIPPNLKQTIRNVKGKRIWINYTDIEQIRTTTQGDNYVEFQMPSKN